MKLLKICGSGNGYKDMWFEFKTDCNINYVTVEVNKGTELLKTYECQINEDNFNRLIKEFSFLENEKDLLKLLCDISYKVVEIREVL